MEESCRQMLAIAHRGNLSACVHAWRRVQRPRQTYVWPIRQLLNQGQLLVSALKLMTVGSTPCRYIELAILITLNIALQLILVHCSSSRVVQCCNRNRAGANNRTRARTRTRSTNRTRLCMHFQSDSADRGPVRALTSRSRLRLHSLGPRHRVRRCRLLEGTPAIATVSLRTEETHWHCWCRCRRRS